ncbi:MAG TPA: hypothetical protein VKU19_19300 [Bryobacteraceae bacterium]|nr:hypothetical protein [Bryobacteraceae bacterium]
MKLTRRKLAQAMLAPVAVSAAAQTQAPPPLPANPDEELRAARDRIKTLSDALAKQTVPMDTEPALAFKA